MTLRHMKIFLSVCECGSITAAADKLCISQPAVSLAVKELETYYGVVLFDRISRKLFITEAGKRFLAYAGQIISLFDEMEKDIKDWDSFGQLRIGSSITIGTCLMPSYVKQYSILHPSVRVNVIVDNSQVIVNRILRNELDFALIEGFIQSNNIVLKTFMEDEVVIVCGVNHAFAAKPEVSLSELALQAFILREKGSGTRELFDSTMLMHDLVITPLWESVSTESIINAVSKGIGISVLPLKLVKREIDAHRLIRVKIKGIEFKRNFNIIYHKDKHLSGSAKAFMNMCQTTSESEEFDWKH